MGSEAACSLPHQGTQGSSSLPWPKVTIISITFAIVVIMTLQRGLNNWTTLKGEYWRGKSV